MHGANGNSRRTELRLLGHESFRSGAKDVFEIDEPFLGDIKSVTVHHDNKRCFRHPPLQPKP
jgi:hypothetical protein